MESGDVLRKAVEEIKAESFDAVRTLSAQQDDEHDEIRVCICYVGLCTQFRFV